MSEAFDPYHRWLGIPPKDQPPHHYRLLGIDLFENDHEVIRDATERQMAHVRRYQLGQHSEISQKILNELAAAKSCLIDRDKKASYDAALKAKLSTSDSSTEYLAPAIPPPPVLLPSSNNKYSSIYIGLGTAVTLAGILAALFGLYGNNRDSEILKSHDQAVQEIVPPKQNPPDQHASNKTPYNGKPVEAKISGLPAKKPPADNQSMATVKQGPAKEVVEGDFLRTDKTGLKPDIDKELKEDQFQPQSETAGLDNKEPQSNKNIPAAVSPKVASNNIPELFPPKNNSHQPVLGNNKSKNNEPLPLNKSTATSSSVNRFQDVLDRLTFAFNKNDYIGMRRNLSTENMIEPWPMPEFRLQFQRLKNDYGKMIEWNTNSSSKDNLVGAPIITESIVNGKRVINTVTPGYKNATKANVTAQFERGTVEFDIWFDLQDKIIKLRLISEKRNNK